MPIGGPQEGVSGEEGALPGELPTGDSQEGVSGEEGALPGELSVEGPQEEVSGDKDPLSDAESERVRFNSSLSIYIFSLSYTIILI